MRRLIDADKFEGFIRKKYADSEKAEDIKEQMLFDLSYQPTAYDPDKVVEQLKKVAFERYGNDGMGGEMVVNMDDAIEIVKGGGVDAKTDS